MIKKALIITHHYLNGNGGGVYASRAYINAFSECTENLYLLYPVKGNELCEGINKKITAYPIRYDKNPYDKFIDLCKGRVHRYNDVFSFYMQQIKPDVVIFDKSTCSFRLIDKAHNFGAKVITIHHNYEYEYDKDNNKGILKALQLFWDKRYEKEAVQKSDLNITLTTQDTYKLAQTFNDNDISKFEKLGCFEYTQSNVNIFNHDSTICKHRFVITGNLSAVQTELSLIKWLDVYYPILKDIDTEASLIIAGKSPSTKLKSKCKELGIKIIPSPENMSVILKNSDYYICPTELGGGLKLRIMDGLKYGLPVITHEVSARGYDDFTELGFVIPYHDSLSFRNALIKISSSHIKRAEIVKNYQQLFSYKSGVERLKSILIKRFFY